nr:GNAT family N-acetyltransferase [Ruminococcus sp.]
MNNLFVLPDYRHSDIGQALFSHACARSKH